MLPRQYAVLTAHRKRHSLRLLVRVKILDEWCSNRCASAIPPASAFVPRFIPL
ncbi:hypothetical protein HBH56_132830 [Parastagonospora nodorum]|uniref:Uncharacterized protein n=1 Tax=Phaeosphaeria nodorum (strain SN15 / ATCC MYA-4574 / FGSC 10173) TaxID=321614 RepID=A0A7U2FEK8_PHANO|nr:hypothetical protein HBH56_132830 [Parastagonospora nodorum]QRD02784.1 hypothetical protein JI435_418650 [Parastagonospora nodorum SN15]KAH3926913.1 hypothetical protein HBH54_160400 [Parastagonospora nodorum]KAH3949265.1 hypothetical protein HBH53_087790 [Parastagonospora nodorum]KAH3977929.1 hypothetical protein HBH51_068090 [Parastagonospora nodorum]